MDAREAPREATAAGAVEAAGMMNLRPMGCGEMETWMQREMVKTRQENKAHAFLSSSHPLLSSTYVRHAGREGCPEERPDDGGGDGGSVHAIPGVQENSPVARFQGSRSGGGRTRRGGGDLVNEGDRIKDGAVEGGHGVSVWRRRVKREKGSDWVGGGGGSVLRKRRKGGALLVLFRH